MALEVGQNSTQTFTHFDDTESLNGSLCGGKTYELAPPHHSFITFIFNATTGEYELTVLPTSEDQVGEYYLFLDVWLNDYEHTVPHRLQEIKVTVLTGINFPPYFDPPLNQSFPAQVGKTNDRQSWSLTLPPVKDFENDDV